MVAICRLTPCDGADQVEYTPVSSLVVEVIELTLSMSLRQFIIVWLSLLLLCGSNTFSRADYGSNRDRLDKSIKFGTVTPAT